MAETNERKLLKTEISLYYACKNNLEKVSRQYLIDFFFYSRCPKTYLGKCPPLCDMDLLIFPCGLSVCSMPIVMQSVPVCEAGILPLGTQPFSTAWLGPVWLWIWGHSPGFLTLWAGWHTEPSSMVDLYWVPLLSRRVFPGLPWLRSSREKGPNASSYPSAHLSASIIAEATRQQCLTPKGFSDHWLRLLHDWRKGSQCPL